MAFKVMKNEIEKILDTMVYQRFPTNEVKLMRRKLRALAREAFKYGCSHFKTSGEVQFKEKFGFKPPSPYKQLKGRRYDDSTGFEQGN